MYSKIGSEIIKNIAQKEGVSVMEVRNEMKKAISIGYMNREHNKNWNQYFKDDALPTPEEFIVILAASMTK